MLKPDYTSKFEKDYKRAMKRNYDITLLDDVISKVGAAFCRPISPLT
jgi:mRNA-degrading endonuclease YafQ of YafQ-DinJ toxin-antitoxin module